MTNRKQLLSALSLILVVARHNRLNGLHLKAYPNPLKKTATFSLMFSRLSS